MIYFSVGLPPGGRGYVVARGCFGIVMVGCCRVLSALIIAVVGWVFYENFWPPWVGENVNYQRGRGEAPDTRGMISWAPAMRCIAAIEKSIRGWW